ncbi:hypothetical protein BCV71DRAFT_262345 [Rhizopus microsporus]|uniref:Uncharacterized protein n=1 Tax=Rhizopus microsporus TaxID=58291 RepID=A0A1X0S6Y4_RHIZD|nr:hypothetical protein BCV71DRAFT_262345 [Rhizopus microsporus]
MAKKEIITKGSYQQKELHSEEMLIALASIITNIKNMWSDNTIFKKLLDHLLNVLLKSHLAENRAAEYSEYIKNIKEKSKSTTVATSSLNKLERELESLDDDEDKRQRFERRITRGHGRITYLKSLPKKTVSRMKPARNIKMMSVEAACLVYNQLDNIQRELPDATEKELQTQMLIAQTLQSYIQDKQNRFAVAHQFPLCILANDILRATEYAKFTRQLFPLPCLSYLDALQVNASSLYQIMTSGPDALLISDFNQKAIDSIEYARSNKHAVFSSIFDMSEITNTCDSYKLKFAYNIQILPGLKTPRILGTTTKEHSNLLLKKSLSYTQRMVQDPNIVEQHQKGLAILQAEIINSQQELNKPQATLEKLQKSDHEVVLGAKTKQLKDRFKSLLTRDERESTWHDMKCLKEERNQHRMEVINCCSFVSSLKQDSYRKRMAVRFDKAIQEQVKRSGQEEKDDPIKINSQTTVNLSTSLPFTSQRFQLDIQLCNRYHVLQEPDVDIKDEEAAFLNLLQSETINANEIDINCMHKKNRKHLERLKKKTSQGEEVSTLEAKLEKASLSASSNVEKFQQNYRVHEDCSKKLRSFYNSSNRTNRLRSLEIQKKSTWITAQERKSLTKANTGADKKQLLMFIGDRGTGIGSRIKGFRDTEVDGRSSCVKLCHPKAMLTKKNKQVSQEIKGALMCVNPKCVAVKSGRSTKSRDALFSLAIGLSGLTQCLIGSPLLPFAQPQISQFNTDTVNKPSWSFVPARDHLTSTMCAYTIVVPCEGLFV